MTATADAISVLGRALAGDVDWRAVGDDELRWFQGAASHHGVGPLLWERLAGAAGASAALRAALDSEVRAAATRDLFIQRDLQTVLGALAAAAIPVLVTKGTALAYTVYPQPWLRPRTDSDLLVRHNDVTGAGRVLEACGYTRSDALSTGVLVSHQVAFERTDQHGVHHVIDLHWKVVNPHVVADALPFDDLWKEAQQAVSLGPAARVPSVVASVALGSLHRLAHHQGFDRLIWLYDIKLLTETMSRDEWVALRDLACRRGIAGFCLDGLRASRRSLGTDVPEDIDASLAAAAPMEPSRAFMSGSISKRDVLLSDLQVLETWRDRLRLLREHAFPPAAFMRQKYNNRPRWPLPALYVHRLLAGASKWIR